MTAANLSCFRCGEEFECVGSDNTDLLFECENCGVELREDTTRELATMDGALARLAEVLLAKAGEGE